MLNTKYNKSLFIDAPFESDRTKGGIPMPALKEDSVTSHKIQLLIDELEYIYRYFKDNTIINGFIATIFYNRIAPKTSRVQRIFSHEKEAYENTVGARFGSNGLDNKGNPRLRHIVTYFVSEYEILSTISELKAAKKVVDDSYKGDFRKENLDKGNKNSQAIFFKNQPIKMSNFFWVMQDVSMIDKIDVLLPDNITPSKDTLVTFFPCFKEKGSLGLILNKMGITVKGGVLDDWNVILSPDQLEILMSSAPYLVCMNNDDFSSYNEDDYEEEDNSFSRRLPPVTDDMPTIGLFDTMFEENSYLKDYVTFENLVSDEYMKNSDNMVHGTKIDSILVEGDKLNPDYDDECGFFKVMHFGVGGKKSIDVPVLFKAIEEQVKKYCHKVKVWNISLGDERGINPNYLSLLGAKIDEVSRKYNVLFVVSGTNYSEKYKDITIGAPADSFNAIVVNSVISKDNPIPPSYARKGPVLTFFQKPDVCYYGGDKDNPLYCYSPNGDYYCCGTSFAAPFIARKAAFLINKMHLSVECAKALIIDSAYGWNVRTGNNNNSFMGYGIVPISVKEIVMSKKDEIKMIFSGKTIEQGTLIHDLPILIDQNNKFGFTAKLTFCYFTYGSRNQGVDYSDQEISVKFGKSNKKLDLRDNLEHYVVDSINKDKQAMENSFVGEGKAIGDFGKWNNTKVLIEKKCEQKREKDYNGIPPWWGIYVRHLDRYSSISAERWKNNPDSVSVKFGIVATFKTVDGTDADIDTYIKRIRANNNYHIREIDLEIENDISLQENVDIVFDK